MTAPQTVLSAPPPVDLYWHPGPMVRDFRPWPSSPSLNENPGLNMVEKDFRAEKLFLAFLPACSSMNVPRKSSILPDTCDWSGFDGPVGPVGRCLSDKRSRDSCGQDELGRLGLVPPSDCPGLSPASGCPGLFKPILVAMLTDADTRDPFLCPAMISSSGLCNSMYVDAGSWSMLDSSHSVESRGIRPVESWGTRRRSGATSTSRRGSKEASSRISSKRILRAATREWSAWRSQ
mmetsp:Transcript_35143/g.111062  ORF Transcript_35143/g.111062 Transcript_35143/m.111062 type:complete len:234 (-) Transcript_35143:658-1359(-)